MAGTATSRDSIGRVARVHGVVRQLDPRSEVAVLDLLCCVGRPALPNRSIRLAGQFTLSAAAWTTGLFVANELRGVIRAGDVSREGPVEAELFVDEAWRRRGIGSVLLKATLDWARCGEAATLRFVCDRNDWPMRHFAEKFGARLDLVFGQMVADIPLERQ